MPAEAMRALINFEDTLLAYRDLEPATPVANLDEQTVAQVIEIYLRWKAVAIQALVLNRHGIDPASDSGKLLGAPWQDYRGLDPGTPVWADNMPGLLEHRSVYALDLLGEPGKSIQARPITSNADKAAWLHEVIDQLPEPHVHVVGLSIGGWTATNLALHQPDKIVSLTLIEPVMVFTGLSTEAIVRSIPASVSWFPKAWRDSFSSWTAGGAPVEDVPVARMIEAGMQSYQMAQPGPSRFPDQELHELRVPTLVIVASDSPMHDPDKLVTGAQQLPNGEVHTYPGTSHAINGEEPEQLAADIGSFVDAHEQPKP